MDAFNVIEGDLLNAKRGFIIHGVNDRGVMGSGVAAGVRARWPGAYDVYRQAFEAGELKRGTCTFYQVNKDLWIVNAVTQTLGTADPLDLNALASCFFKTLTFMVAYESATGAVDLPLLFPMIGAGRAGGNWIVIKKLINAELNASKLSFGHVRPATLFTVKVEPADCR